MGSALKFLDFEANRRRAGLRFRCRIHGSRIRPSNDQACREYRRPDHEEFQRPGPEAGGAWLDRVRTMEQHQHPLKERRWNADLSPWRPGRHQSAWNRPRPSSPETMPCRARTMRSWKMSHNGSRPRDRQETPGRSGAESEATRYGGEKTREIGPSSQSFRTNDRIARCGRPHVRGSGARIEDHRTEGRGIPG